MMKEVGINKATNSFKIPMVCFIFGIAFILGAMHLDSTERRYDLCGEVIYKIKPYEVDNKMKYEVITAAHTKPVSLDPKQYFKTKVKEGVCTLEREHKYTVYCIAMCVVGIIFIVLGIFFLMAADCIDEALDMGDIMLAFD